jgi:hypothetical protein
MSDKKILTVDKAIENFVISARENIYPIDKLAYATVMDVVNMLLVSLARKQNIELEFPEENDKNNKDIDDIMKQVQEGTKTDE